MSPVDAAAGTAALAPPPASPSDLPRRPAGTRARSGNAMLRARTAVLDAAAHCVERYGVRRTTMGDVALKAAVAKATLYNHFRTKDDVLAALVDSRVTALAAECEQLAAQSLPTALGHAAHALATSGPLRRVVSDEPALAARLAAPGDGRGWQAVRTAVRDCLRTGGAAHDDDAVDLVLRWLLSQVLWPAPPAQAAAHAAALAAALAADTVGT
jgi:AcrR family transcriptional regulator